jgi:hypothetical protein
MARRRGVPVHRKGVLVIDSQELQAIRERSDAAKSAVETVQVHADGGLFGEIPLAAAAALFPAAVASAKDVPGLLADLERLTPAAYLSGPEDCCEGDCIDGEKPADGEWCSHVTERVAAFDDVKRAEALAEIVQSVRRRLGELSGSTRLARDVAADLVGDIDNALEAMEAYESAGWVH